MSTISLRLYTTELASRSKACARIEVEDTERGSCNTLHLDAGLQLFGNKRAGKSRCCGHLLVFLSKSLHRFFPVKTEDIFHRYGTQPKGFEEGINDISGIFATGELVDTGTAATESARVVLLDKIKTLTPCQDRLLNLGLFLLLAVGTQIKVFFIFLNTLKC